jgi:hypothetical protein
MASMREESVETARLEAPAVATRSYDRMDRELGRWVVVGGWGVGGGAALLLWVELGAVLCYWPEPAVWDQG